MTFMRSAAKPLQIQPFLRSGALEDYGITAQEVALACASHNSEVYQVDLVKQYLEKLGCHEDDLACGPHRSLHTELGLDLIRLEREPDIAAPAAVSSNCSAKHASMLALARERGWPIAGYHEPGHPVQQACLAEVAEWTGVTEDSIGVSVDGCGVSTFAVPLRAMARSYAKLASRIDEGASVAIGAMMGYPDLVAGARRLDSILMRAFPGRVFAKVGAGGVYLAGLPDEGIGLAIKVEDGHPRAAEVALMWVLAELGMDTGKTESLNLFVDMPLLNTRGERVGDVEVVVG